MSLAPSGSTSFARSYPLWRCKMMSRVRARACACSGVRVRGRMRARVCTGVCDGCPRHEAVVALPADQISISRRPPWPSSPLRRNSPCPLDTRGHQRPDSNMLKSLHRLILIARARLLFPQRVCADAYGRVFECECFGHLQNAQGAGACSTCPPGSTSPAASTSFASCMSSPTSLLLLAPLLAREPAQPSQARARNRSRAAR